MGFASFEERKMNILIKDIAKVLQDFGIPANSIPSYISTLRNEVRRHGVSNYVIERYNAYWSQFLHGEISNRELVTLVAILALYADALQRNKLQHGSLSQLWTPAEQGWHPVLNRMVTLGCSTEIPVQGLDPYSLSLLRDPSDLAKTLLGFTCFHRRVTFLPGPEGFDSIPCSQPGGAILLGRRRMHEKDGEIVFLYRVEHASTRFAITLTPLWGDKGFTGSYRLSASWHTGSTRPKAAFGIEELIAKSLPFGELDLTLPLLTPAKEEQQTLLA